MTKRILRKRNKAFFVKGFGATKATRAFAYEVRAGGLKRYAATRLHFRKESETRPHVFYTEKILIRIFPDYENLFD